VQIYKSYLNWQCPFREVLKFFLFIGYQLVSEQFRTW